MVFLTFLEVFNYLHATPSSRCIVEGQQVLNANHLTLVGLKNQSQTELCLYALCLKTSALKESPHTIEGWISLEMDGAKIRNFECSCKAGKSTCCKHITALLLLCTRSNILEFEQLSCTDLECYWKKEKTRILKDYEPVPITETVEIKKLEQSTKYSLIEISHEKKEQLVHEFCTVAPESALAKHKKGRFCTPNKDYKNKTNVSCDMDSLFSCATQSQIINNLPDICPNKQCCKEVYEKLKMSDFVAVAVESAQNKLLWKKERQFRITGSRCYELFTYGKGEWPSKCLKYFWPKDDGWQRKNAYIQHGIRTEGEARSCYKADKNCDILETGLIICQKHPWLAYSPDGIVMEGSQPIRLLEIKCPFLGKTKPIAKVVDTCVYLFKNERGEVILKKKHQYYAQVQLGLILLNLPECDFIVYSSFSKSFVCIRVDIDLEFAQSLVYKLQSIFFNNMLHEICKNS